jgi:hypothetical protein
LKPTDPRNPLGYKFATAHLEWQGDDCVIWPYSCCTAGYGSFSYQRKKYLAHRFVCEHTNGPPPGPRYQAAHSCGNRRCINPKHLSWKTPAGNQLDRRTHGTHNKTRRKLTPIQAEQIRRLKGVETGIKTAAKYGVTESNVRLIQDGKTWLNTGKHHLWTPEEDATIRAAIDQGMTMAEVANRVGYKYDSTAARIYRLGLKAKPAARCRS